MANTLPETLTPDVLSLTPDTKSLIVPAKPAWGRLFATLLYLEPVDLDKPSCKFGRSDTCDIVISEQKFPQNRINNISKEHFVITKEAEDSLVFIQDLSKNGTFINGQLIGKNRKNILQDGDEIAISFKALKVYVFKNIQTSGEKYLPPELQRRYEVSRSLGEGACGDVKLIFEKNTCKQYAVKRIKIAKGTSHDSNSMHHPKKIKNEIEILRSLSHPCIISVIEVVETDDSVFIVMEYMEGGELQQLIRGSNVMPENNVKFLFYQIVIAVKYLHCQGITHRDLKPQNILLKSTSYYDTLVKVTDFGLSKIVHDATVMQTSCGTPNYVAPEILNIHVSTYSQQVDVWSMGVILYYMLSQELPFSASNEITLGKLILKGSYSMKGHSWRNISDPAKDLVKRMLIVDPTSRIKVNEILKHPWISEDDVVQSKVDQLLYSHMGTRIFGSDNSADELDSTLHIHKKMKYSEEDD